MTIELDRLLLALDATTESFRREMKRGDQAIVQHERQVERSLGSIEKRFEKYVGGVRASIASLGTGIGAAAVIQLGKEAVLAGDRYNALQGRIREATKASGDYGMVSGEIFNISQRTGTALENNVSLFQRMGVGAKEFGATSSEVLKVTETVQQLGVIGGATTSALSAGTTQFAQAMAAGIIRAEEWNSIVENLPELANAIAAGMGKTVGQMRQAILDGKVLSKDVFAVLLAQSDDVSKRFSEMGDTIERASQRFENAFAQAAGNSDALHGAATGTATALTLLADNLGGVVDALDKTVEPGMALLSMLGKLGGAASDLDGSTPIIKKFFEELTFQALNSANPVAHVMRLLQDAHDLFQDDKEWTGSVGNKGWRGSSGSSMKTRYGGAIPTPEDKPDAPPRPGAAAAARAAERSAARFRDFVTDTATDNRLNIDDLAADKVAQEFEKITRANEDLDESRRQSVETRLEYHNSLMKEGEALRATLDPMFALELQQRDLDEMVQAGAISWDVYRQALARAQEEALLASETWQGGLARSLKGLEDSLGHLDWFSKDIFSSIGSAFKGMVNDLINEAFRMMVLRPLFKSIFGGLGGGSGGGGLIGSLGSLFGGARAEGGPTVPGKAYLVGERGPEIWAPDRAGFVTPNGGGQGGGMVINQYITNRFDVGLESVDQRIRQAAPKIASQAAQSVRDANQRTAGNYMR